MPCSTLLLDDLEALGRMRSTFSGQKRSSRMKTRVTRKLASSRMGTTMTSCSYTRISAKTRLLFGRFSSGDPGGT